MSETSIKITDSGKKSLDRLYDDTGIKKLVIVGRAIEWVGAQDKTLQSIILGQVDPVDAPAMLDLIRQRLEAADADVSPAARIVDETAAAVKAQKRKPSRPARPKEA